MLETLSANLHGFSNSVGNTDGSHDDKSIHGDHDPTSHASEITGVALGLLQAVLNQVDYGLAVVNADTRQLLYANLLAMDALRPDNGQKSGLHLVQGQVCTRQPAHAAQLALALARTKSWLRGLLRLAEDTLTAASGGDDGAVAVMPLFDLTQPMATEVQVARGNSTQTQNFATDSTTVSVEPRHALLVFPKRQLCDTTTLTLFAHERGLTGTEGLVLAMVCKGLRPSEIATSHGVQVCTVRSQLRSIRQKTASDSVRELVEKVSVLPPMARQLHHMA